MTSNNLEFIFDLNSKKDSFINTACVIYNMSEKFQLKIEKLEQRTIAMNVAKKYGMSIPILAEIYRERLKGYNNKQVAHTIGFSENTIQTYLNKIKSMEKEEHILLMKLLFSEYLFDTGLIVEDDKIKFTGDIKNE